MPGIVIPKFPNRLSNSKASSLVSCLSPKKSRNSQEIMKLRLRSMDAAGGETHRVQLPDTAALSDVKACLAAKLSVAQPVSAQSVHLSLNRSEELISPDPSATLPALGLASGDLLYFTLSSMLSHPPPPQPLPQNPNPAALSIPQAVGCSKSPGEAGSSFSPMQTVHVEPASSPLRTLHVEPSLPAASDPPDVVMAEAVDTPQSSSSYVIGVLKQEMAVRMAGSAEGTVLNRLVVALHAALLDDGFFAIDPLGSCLQSPQDQTLGASATLIMKYTLPELVAVSPETEEGKIAVLNYSLMANYMVVYGCVPGAQSEVRRLCLELPKLAPLLYLGSDGVDGMEEREILGLWRVLKDELCLPLMISLCQLNGLRLPPCLMALPGDLKAKVLEFVPGVNLARVECTCKELRDLAADDNLWRRKCELEFKARDEGSSGSRHWKPRFKAAWTVKVANSNRQLSLTPRFWDYGWGNNPHSPPGFSVIGGDSDRLPFIVNHGFLGRLGNQRRNITPNCDFGGRYDNFLD